MTEAPHAHGLREREDATPPAVTASVGRAEAGGRRCTLLDVMILVAATALGLTMNRATPKIPYGGSRISGAIFFALLAAVPHLVAWTFALLLIRLRAPRPGFRRLVRQPGFVACGAAAFVSLLCGGSGLLFLVGGSRVSMTLWSFIDYTPELCFVVVGAWLALAANGRWRAEPGWIDRMGRAIGVLWIASNVLNWMRLILL